MAKWTTTTADLKHFAEIHKKLGDLHPPPTLQIDPYQGRKNHYGHG